jgi:hypothetical protein
VLTKKEDVGVICCILGFARMWAINHTTTIETKNSKTYLDPPSTIQRWNTWKFQMALV